MFFFFFVSVFVYHCKIFATVFVAKLITWSRVGGGRGEEYPTRLQENVIWMSEIDKQNYNIDCQYLI